MRTALKWVTAFASSASGFFGRSVSIICGACNAPTTAKLRDCIEATDRRDRLMVFCPHCQTWNLTDLVVDP